MRHKLLLADDSVTIQRVIELTFADEDVDVVAVGDGKKAIASIQSNPPDIVLADVGMPERDGYEVAAFIKGNPQFASIPVLLLTGAFEPIDEARARSVGCDGVLVKPFEPQMVINRVKDLLASRRPGGMSSASPAAQATARPAAAADTGFDPRPLASEPVTPAAGNSLEDYFDRLDAAFANLDGGASSDLAQPAPSSPPPARPSVDAAPSRAPASRPAPSAFAGDDLGGWDPDLIGDPRKPASIGAPTSEFAPVAVTPMVEPPPPPPAAPIPAVWEPSPPASVVSAAMAAYAAGPQAPPPAAPSSAAYPPVGRSPAVDVPSAAPAAPAAARVMPMPSLAEAFATLLSSEQSHAIEPSSLGAPGVTDEMVDEIVLRVAARMGEQVVRDTVLDVAERLVREEIERIKRA